MDRNFGRYNPYYEPTACGLTLLDSYDLDNEPYQFNLVCVWQDIETGLYYTAEDSGCSCPTPFEDFHWLSDLTQIDAHEAKKVMGR